MLPEYCKNNQAWTCREDYEAVARRTTHNRLSENVWKLLQLHKFIFLASNSLDLNPMNYLVWDAVKKTPIAVPIIQKPS